MTVPAGQVEYRSDFWSSTPGSARWTVQLRNNQWRNCSTTGKQFLKKLKRSIDRSVPASDPGTWNATWTGRLYSAVRRAGYQQIPFISSQTVWTPEMLRFAIWWTFYRGQIGTAFEDAITLPTSNLLTLPRSGVAPPEDGTGSVFSDPACAEPPADQLAPHPFTPTPTVPPPPTPTLDFTSADFWSAAPNSARWQVQLANGQVRLCATQIRSFFRELKRQLAVVPNQNDPGTWTAEDTDRLHRALESLWNDYASHFSDVSQAPIWARSLLQVPFSRTQTTWDPEMLKYAIWYAYHRNDSSPDRITLPANLVLPRSNIAPPNDNQGIIWREDPVRGTVMDATYVQPVCIVVPSASAPGATGSQPDVPPPASQTPSVPGAVVQGGRSDLPSETSRATMLSRVKIVTVFAAFAMLGVYLGKR